MVQEDRDEDRLTQVHFYSVQADPTKSVDDASNYDVNYVVIDAEAEAEDSYGVSKIKQIFCPWLNDGNEAAIRIIGLRLLRRFNNAPKRFKFKVDHRDGEVGLADVVFATSHVLADATGNAQETAMQVISRSETDPGNEVELTAQLYSFEGNYGYIMEDTANDYATATDAEKEGGFYTAPDVGNFADGRKPYEFS